jgi:hypothetical protein
VRFEGSAAAQGLGGDLTSVVEALDIVVRMSDSKCPRDRQGSCKSVKVLEILTDAAGSGIMVPPAFRPLPICFPLLLSVRPAAIFPEGFTQPLVHSGRK